MKAEEEERIRKSVLVECRDVHMFSILCNIFDDDNF